MKRSTANNLVWHQQPVVVGNDPRPTQSLQVPAIVLRILIGAFEQPTALYSHDCIAKKSPIRVTLHLSPIRGTFKTGILAKL